MRQEMPAFIIWAPLEVLESLQNSRELLEEMGNHWKMTHVITEEMTKRSSFIVIYVPECSGDGMDIEQCQQFACQNINNPRMVVYSQGFICGNTCAATKGNKNLAGYDKNIEPGQFTAAFALEAVRFLKEKNGFHEDQIHYLP